MTEISQAVEALGKKLDEIHRRSSLSGFQAAHRQKPGQVEKAIQVALPAIQAQVLAELRDLAAQIENDPGADCGTYIHDVNFVLEAYEATALANPKLGEEG